MTEHTSRDDAGGQAKRRTVLGAALAGGAALLGGVGSTAADPGEQGRGRGGGFPPTGITEYGRSIRLGNGEVRTFTSQTPSDEPVYHGVEIDRAALAGLPTADELADADNTAETDKYRAGGQALVVHGKWSQQYFLPFPAAEETPFTFLGLNWNPEGHPPPNVYTTPHFDVHFHMLDPATVDDIEGPKPAPYGTKDGAIPRERIPEGYARAPQPSQRLYIGDMGEHLVDPSAPEFTGGEFTNTLIQGFIDADGDGSPRWAFVEPMLTREYLRGLRGTDRREVPQPAVYPTEESYPTAYSVRDLPSKDAIAVVMESFEPA